MEKPKETRQQRAATLCILPIAPRSCWLAEVTTFSSLASTRYSNTYESTRTQHSTTIDAPTLSSTARLISHILKSCCSLVSGEEMDGLCSTRAPSDRLRCSTWQSRSSPHQWKLLHPSTPIEATPSREQCPSTPIEAFDLHLSTPMEATPSLSTPMEAAPSREQCTL